MNRTTLLTILTSSHKRSEILELLSEQTRTREFLNDHFHTQSPELQPRLNDLVDWYLISASNSGRDTLYDLTEIGDICSNALGFLMDTVNSIESNMPFWKDHDLSAIPKELLYRINDLKSCTVIKSDDCGFCDSHYEFMEHVLNCKWFKGATCVLNPEWRHMFLERASQGIPIEIIVTVNVYNKLRCEYISELEDLLKNGVKMYVCNEKLKTAFAATNDFFSLALVFKSIESYDNKNDLEGTDPSSIKWGVDLFEYYKEKSVEVQGIQEVNDLVFSPENEKEAVC